MFGFVSVLVKHVSYKTCYTLWPLSPKRMSSIPDQEFFGLCISDGQSLLTLGRVYAWWLGEAARVFHYSQKIPVFHMPLLLFTPPPPPESAVVPDCCDLLCVNPISYFALLFLFIDGSRLSGPDLKIVYFSIPQNNFTLNPCDFDSKRTWQLSKICHNWQYIVSREVVLSLRWRQKKAVCDVISGIAYAIVWQRCIEWKRKKVYALGEQIKFQQRKMLELMGTFESLLRLTPIGLSYCCCLKSRDNLKLRWTELLRTIPRDLSYIQRMCVKARKQEKFLLFPISNLGYLTLSRFQRSDPGFSNHG